MKNFFTVLFGGLACILLCFAVLALLKTAQNFHRESLVATPFTTYTASQPVIVLTALQEEGESSLPTLPTFISSGSKPLSTSTITAKSYIVKDLTTNKVIIEKDSDRLLPIASLTKLITAIVARRLIAPDTHITINSMILRTYGNTANFRDGEAYSVKDLLYPLLMVSSNDAAEALAFVYGRTKFINTMNDFAQSIGAYRTSIADPAGLSPNSISTASDMVRIIDWIRLNDPTILQITELKTITVRDHNWVNPTHFLSWSNYLGGKNGYLPEANRTGVGLFSVDKSSDIYAVAVLGSSARDQDVETLLGQINVRQKQKND